MFGCRPGLQACAEACYFEIERVEAEEPGTDILVENHGCPHEGGLENTSSDIRVSSGAKNARVVAHEYSCQVATCGRTVLYTEWGFTCQRPAESHVL